MLLKRFLFIVENILECIFLYVSFYMLEFYFNVLNYILVFLDVGVMLEN